MRLQMSRLMSRTNAARTGPQVPAGSKKP
jgi:hypothetical protein